MEGLSTQSHTKLIGDPGQNLDSSAEVRLHSSLLAMIALVWLRLSLPQMLSHQRKIPRQTTYLDHFKSQADEAIGYTKRRFNVRPARSKGFLVLEDHVPNSWAHTYTPSSHKLFVSSSRD